MGSVRLVAVLALTAALVGPTALAAPEPTTPMGPGAVSGSTDGAGSQVVLTTSAGDSPVPGDVLQVPSIGLEAALVDVTLGSNGVLSPPTDTSLVGRWNDSAKIGSRRGQSVLTGHAVHTGGGVMNRLGEVERGDRIRATDDGAAVDYIVTSVRKYSRAEIAQQAQSLFGQDRPANRLVLVTCADWTSDGIYLSNIVVSAWPVRRG